MKRLILIALILTASTAFSQRVFYRSAAKFDTVTVTYSLITSANQTVDSIYARSIRASAATLVGTTLGVAGATVDSSVSATGGKFRGLRVTANATVVGNSTLDSAYIRSLRTSGAAIIGTALTATGGTTTVDSIYLRSAKSSGAFIIGGAITLPGSGTLVKVDSASKVHADTAAIWIGGVAYVLPKRP